MSKHADSSGSYDRRAPARHGPRRTSQREARKARKGDKGRARAIARSSLPYTQASLVGSTALTLRAFMCLHVHGIVCRDQPPPPGRAKRIWG